MTVPNVAAPVRFSTVGLPETRRIELWEDHNANALIGLRCRTLTDSTLEATELNVQLDRVHLARVVGNSHTVERTTDVIRRSPAESIACYLTLVGEAFFYHEDGVRTLHPGQLIMCDADQPFMRGFSNGLEELAIKVPRPTFTEWTGLSSLDRPIVLDFAKGELQARTLARIVGRAVRSQDPQPIDERTVLALVAGLTGARPADLSTVHLAAARAFVDERCADPNLSAARVAEAVGISERHLSRVFASSDTSLPQYVLARRLELANAMLIESPGLPVTEVASHCGFGSATYFSHAFKERFGLRATDVRRRARVTQQRS